MLTGRAIMCPASLPQGQHPGTRREQQHRTGLGYGRKGVRKVVVADRLSHRQSLGVIEREMDSA